MNLLQSYFQTMYKINFDSQPDGRGSQMETKTTEQKFNASIVFKGGTDEVKALRQDATVQYDLYIFTDGIELAYHDIIRGADGKTYRITSDGNLMKVPRFSSVCRSHATAEEYEIELS